jgi:hypothetical protein|tara:strand:+ start:1111 stop:2712 length:1602 start_codon:yes stop_codon:yes gene_type:complete
MRRRGLHDAVELLEAVLAEAEEQLTIVRDLGVEEQDYVETLRHRAPVEKLTSMAGKCATSSAALDRRALELRAVELEFQWQMLCAHRGSDAATQEAPAAVRESGSVRATRFKLAQNIAAAVVCFEHVALDTTECEAVDAGSPEATFLKSVRAHKRPYGAMARAVATCASSVLLVASFIGKVKRADGKALERLSEAREKKEMGGVERAQRRAEARVAREDRIRAAAEAEKALCRAKWARGRELREQDVAAARAREETVARVAVEEKVQRAVREKEQRLLMESELDDPWTAMKLGARVSRVESILSGEAQRLAVQEKRSLDINAASRPGDGGVGIVSSGVYADGGEVLLHTAAWHGQAETVEMLLRGKPWRADAGAVEGGPYSGTSALQLAARANEGAAVRALVRNAGARGRTILSNSDFAGDNALHTAARYDAIDAVYALLSMERAKDPDPTVNELDPFWLMVGGVNERGRSAADVAVSYEVRTLLRAAEERLPRVLLVELLEVQRLRIAAERLHEQYEREKLSNSAPKLRSHT